MVRRRHWYYLPINNSYNDTFPYLFSSTYEHCACFVYRMSNVFVRVWAVWLYLQFALVIPVWKLISGYCVVVVVNFRLGRMLNIYFYHFLNIYVMYSLNYIFSFYFRFFFFSLLSLFIRCHHTGRYRCKTTNRAIINARIIINVSYR